MTYDVEQVRSYFNAAEDREGRRLDATLRGRISYAIHRRILLDAVAPGMRVADVGSGPGRFAVDAISAGASVTLVDLSAEMLRQARVQLAQAEVEAEAYVEADVCDLSGFRAESFDLVLCYGGAISYSYDSYQRAVEELVRIAKPGAAILVSVMTLVGAMGLIGSFDDVELVEHWSAHMPDVDWDHDDVVLTVPGSIEFHLPLALFNSTGLARAFAMSSCGIERFAVSNPISLRGQEFEQISASPEASARLMELELALSERPGLRDSGEHLIALARKPAV